MPSQNPINKLEKIIDSLYTETLQATIFHHPKSFINTDLRETLPLHSPFQPWQYHLLFRTAPCQTTRKMAAVIVSDERNSQKYSFQVVPSSKESKSNFLVGSKSSFFKWTKRVFLDLDLSICKYLKKTLGRGCLSNSDHKDSSVCHCHWAEIQSSFDEQNKMFVR